LLDKKLILENKRSNLKTSRKYKIASLILIKKWFIFLIFKPAFNKRDIYYKGQRNCINENHVNCLNLLTILSKFC